MIGRKVKLVGGDWPDYRRGFEEKVHSVSELGELQAEDGLLLGWIREGQFVPRPGKDNDNGYDFSTELVPLPGEANPCGTLRLSASDVQGLAEAVTKHLPKILTKAPFADPAMDPYPPLEDMDATIRITVEYLSAYDNTPVSLELPVNHKTAKVAAAMVEKTIDMIYEGEL